MLKYILHFLLFCSPAICFGQDILVKRDSSKIEAKILEIRPAQIKYKYFNYQDGPTLVVHKNEIAYVIYQNGQSERFQVLPEPVLSNQPIYVNVSSKKDSLRHASKIGDYIKFNIQAGAVINNSYSNLERRQPQSGQASSTEYSGDSKNNYNCNFTIGFNFILGKNDYVKHVIGINYLRSKGEFNYNHSLGGDPSYKTDLHYVSKIDFINFTTGLRFAVGKHLFIEPLASFNLIAAADVRYSGAHTTTYRAGYPPLYTSAVETEYYHNEKAGPERKQMVHTISLCPRVSYEFKVKQHTLGVYLSYNVSYRFRLPWYMIGVTYYPFKKLSGPLNGKKLKLFNKMEVSVDVGVVMNNSYSNKAKDQNNKYKSPAYDADYFDSKTPRHKETGLNLGINLAHGNSPVCKHLLGLSYVQSKSEFTRTLGRHYTESDKHYQYWNTARYSTTVHFLNISTGIRLTAFKHLNFDNSIALTIPLLGTNKINGVEYTRESSPTGSGSYYESNYTEQKINTTSSELFVRPAVSFIPRISYDFHIGQQRFGIYYSRNFSFEYRLPWNMMGVTYYPFKKLR